MGLVATVVGLSGSAIVYRESLDHMLAPHLHDTSALAAKPAETLLANVESAGCAETGKA